MLMETRTDEQRRTRRQVEAGLAAIPPAPAAAGPEPLTPERRYGLLQDAVVEIEGARLAMKSGDLVGADRVLRNALQHLGRAMGVYPGRLTRGAGAR